MSCARSERRSELVLSLACLLLLLNCSLVTAQLDKVVKGLAASGKLPIAAQSVAGFTAHTLCEGVQNSHACWTITAIGVGLKPVLVHSTPFDLFTC